MVIRIPNVHLGHSCLNSCRRFFGQAFLSSAILGLHPTQAQIKLYDGAHVRRGFAATSWVQPLARWPGICRVMARLGFDDDDDDFLADCKEQVEYEV